MTKTTLHYSALRDRSGESILVDGIDVAVFKLDGRLFALRNDCPHQHFHILHEGVMIEGAVICPMHGWAFDLETGESRAGQGRLTTYPVSVEKDVVYVDVGV